MPPNPPDEDDYNALLDEVKELKEYIKELEANYKRLKKMYRRAVDSRRVIQAYPAVKRVEKNDDDK